jgi:phosphoribosyl 1,2-cyclic phosphate phosphodiesterase
MKFKLLGTGSSFGSPMIGCKCEICQSADPKHHRLRTSLLISYGDINILVDAGPDFRAQALKYGIDKIDAVIFTHAHFDHIAGIGDLRPLFFGKKELIESYMTETTYNSIMKGYGYAYEDQKQEYRPYMKANIVAPYDELEVMGIKIKLFEQEHGSIKSLGLRIGDFTYSTDCKGFSPKSMEIIKGTKCWILDCLRFENAPTHFTLEEATRVIEIIKPQEVHLIHLGHGVDYHAIEAAAPKNTRVAYDGLEIIL